MNVNGFKNPFDELGDDQIIRLQTQTNQETATTKHHNNKKKKHKNTNDNRERNKGKDQSMQNLEDSVIQLTKPKQKISNQSHQFDVEETIFMGKGDAFQSKSSQLPTDEQPPLLQDIGIDVSLTIDKIISIIKFEKPYHRYIEMPDLFGPLLIGFVFGALLLLSGKIHFGDIYALFVIGNILMFLLFNLMSKNQIVSLYSIMSSLGYCLLPLLIVGLIGIVFSLKNTFGIILSLSLSCWCAYSASNYIQMQINSIEDNKKALIVYPLYLYYVSFAMITIF